jgi:hypothetical protein
MVSSDMHRCWNKPQRTRCRTAFLEEDYPFHRFQWERGRQYCLYRAQLGPQLSAVNSTSYEWWYFDAVSPDLESAITIVFYTALSSGFGLLPPSSDVAVISVDFLFPNETSRSVDLAATEAVITTIDQGSSAVYKGAGAQWQGAPDLSSYIVSIDSPKSGVMGTFKLKSRAPAQ